MSHKLQKIIGLWVSVKRYIVNINRFVKTNENRWSRDLSYWGNHVVHEYYVHYTEYSHVTLWQNVSKFWNPLLPPHLALLCDAHQTAGLQSVADTRAACPTAAVWNAFWWMSCYSRSLTLVCVRKVPGFSEAPGSVKMLPVSSGAGCPCRLALGCLQDSCLLSMRSRPPFFVKPAVSTPRLLPVWMMDLHLGRAWFGRSACGLFRVIFMSPNLPTRATMSLVHTYVG